MRFTRTLRTASIAALMVGAVAAAPFLAGADAEAKNRKNKAVDSFATDRDNTRPVDEVRGPFFGLRGNSMDIASAAKIVSCYQYRCPGVTAGTAETYTLVRSIQVDREIDINSCDETLAPISEGVTYYARSDTTRWIRDIGPNGVTPIGGWIGRLQIVAVVEACEGELHRARLLDIGLIGTQGLRPRRGDPDVSTDIAEPDRCSAVFHDEGYYQGYPQKRGLKLLARHFAEDDAALAHLRTLSRSVVAGTFEGRMGLDTSAADPFDFCQLRKVAWWMDGVMGYACRMPNTDPADPLPVPAPLPEDAELFE